MDPISTKSDIGGLVFQTNYRTASITNLAPNPNFFLTAREGNSMPLGKKEKYQEAARLFMPHASCKRASFPVHENRSQATC